MSQTATLIKEKVFDVESAIRIRIGDPCYFEDIRRGSQNKLLKKLTFDGPIVEAPLAKLRVQLNKIECEDDIYGCFEYESIDVDVVEAAESKVVDLYLDHRFYPAYVKEEHELGCDTAQFDMEVRTQKGFASDRFHTGGDGYYGSLTKMTKGYGMMMNLSFDTDLFTFDEVVDRMLKLFPESKNKKTEMS